MQEKEKEEILKLKNECLELEEQVKLLVKTELKLRRTQAELIDSKEKIEEYSRTLEQKVEERTKDLRESEKRFRDIAYSSGDWIWETDLNGVFTYCSEKIEDILGYKPHEIIGKRAYDFMPEDEIDTRKIIEETVRKREPFEDIQSWHIAKNNKRICSLTSGVPIFDSRGEFIGYRGIDKDITERKQAEMKINEVMKELSRSNKELEQFAYIASHDLQEPLRIISSYIMLTLKEGIDGKSKEYLERMQNAAKRMQDLIKGLLDYSRITTNAPFFREVNLEKIVMDAVADLEARIRDTGGKVEVGDLPVIKADALQMRQLFQNLISNALKFHKQGETPLVKLYLSDKNDKDYYRLIVEDNGVGIDKKDHERIFGVFQRLHGKSEYEGSGIGLAVCMKIVENHDGKINVESEEKTGTKFIITLPVRSN